ncbi:MAG: hypothetical protein ONB23_03365 [candidate division KSB1 bacterium]|nr:hypothetical protein [candidate division KSB1 bacterium]
MTPKRGIFRALPLAVAAGTLCAGWIQGCASRGPGVQLYERMRWPEICRALEARWDGFLCLETQIRYSAETPFGNVGGYGRLAYDSSLKKWAVELRGPLGVLVLCGFASPETSWVYIPWENMLYVAGRAEALLFWTEGISKVWLAVLGRCPLGCRDEVRLMRRSNELVVVETGPSGQVVGVRLDPKGGDLFQLGWQSDRTGLTVHYEGYRTVGGQRLPGLVRIESNSPRARIAVSLVEPRVNRAISWSRYRFRVPPSARQASFHELAEFWRSFQGG